MIDESYKSTRNEGMMMEIVGYTSFLQSTVIPEVENERNLPEVYHEQRSLSMFAFPICYCSMILSGAKCSVKMSYYEGRDNHLEHAGTETSNGLESDSSWAIERG